MGDIFINHDRDLAAAEACFRKILEVEPDHVQARHNLCVVYVEQGDLARAETCLVEVSQLAPHETYIQQHLNIVRRRLYTGSQVLYLVLPYFITLPFYLARCPGCLTFMARSWAAQHRLRDFCRAWIMPCLTCL